MSPTHPTSSHAEPRQVPAREIAEALAGVRFPADRRRLVEQARLNDAPRPVVQAIEELPHRRFRDLEDVRRNHGRRRDDPLREVGAP